MDVVECMEHGSQEETYVCKHLVSSLTTQRPIGFYWSSEPRQSEIGMNGQRHSQIFRYSAARAMTKSKL